MSTNHSKPTIIEPQQNRAFSFFGVIVDKQTYKSLAYILLLFPASIAWFTYTVTMTSLSLGLLVTIFGIPLTYIFLLSLPRIITIQGAIAQELTGVDMPVVRHEIPEGNIFEKIASLLQNPLTYTTILYGFLILPLGIFYFVTSISLLSVGISLSLVILYPIVRSILQNFGVEYNENYMTYLPAWVPEWAVLVGISVFGILLLMGALHLIRAMARFDAELLSKILSLT